MTNLYYKLFITVYRSPWRLSSCLKRVEEYDNLDPSSINNAEIFKEGPTLKYHSNQNS